ncbi:MAG: alanine--tRNA ligase-related protein [Thermoplasmata archaeon]
MSDGGQLVYLQGIEGSYVKETDVKVLGYDSGGYILDKTIMHYQGGGQPGDRGMLISGDVKIPIYNVKKKGKNVLHLSNTEMDIGSGKLVLDWERRYKIMKMHTLQHAISAVMFSSGYRSLVTEVFPAYGYIESDSENMVMADEAYNINKTARGLTRYFVKRNELDPKLMARCNLDKLPKSIDEVSVVEIEGLDVCACAGTHVKNTTEIGDYWIRSPGNKIEFGLF